MTKQELRLSVVNTAKSWLGAKESDGSHKPIIDLYNSHKPLARGYKVKYTDKWCATFVSAVAIKCGLTDIIPTECGCGEMIALFQKMGCWQESDAHTPQIGDLVFYDWQDNGRGDNTGWPDHVGFVTEVTGNNFVVIEGNKDDAVGYRTMAINGRYIRGFATPNYASKATKPEPEPTPTPAPSQPTATKKVDYANSFNRKIAGAYRTKTDLNLRYTPGVIKPDNVVCVIPGGALVRCYGYYTDVKGKAWYLVAYGGKSGFVNSGYLK